MKMFFEEQIDRYRQQAESITEPSRSAVKEMRRIHDSIDKHFLAFVALYFLTEASIAYMGLLTDLSLWVRAVIIISPAIPIFVVWSWVDYKLHKIREGED